MSDFGAFVKKKKGVAKPSAPAETKSTKKEVAEKREELGPEVISDEAAEAILVHEASKKEEVPSGEDTVLEAETVEEAAKPPAPSSSKPPKPKATPAPPTVAPSKSSAPTPSSESTPAPEVHTSKDLHDAVQVSDFGDAYEDSEYGGKQSITVVGEKGAGKSTLALAFPGTKLVISYDRMALRNKFKMADPENIKVIDPMPLLDVSSPIRKRDSYVKIYDYLVGVEEYPNGPRSGGLLSEHEPVDWVIHDGTDILMLICEMVMRWRHELLPTQGVDWTLWKDRKNAIQDVYNKSMTLARKGVIYTTYFTDKQLDEDITGQKKTKEQPKWMDIILYQTLHTFVVNTQGENFFLFIHQSKSIKKDVSRKTFDITGTSYESDEIDSKTKEKIWKLDLTKLYDVVNQIVREVF